MQARSHSLGLSLGDVYSVSIAKSISAKVVQLVYILAGSSQFPDITLLVGVGSARKLQPR